MPCPSPSPATAAVPVRGGRLWYARDPLFLSRPRGHRRSPASVFAVAAEGPSCLYVGPLEAASKETLEAFYRQARDSYYSGEPLIIDDMFDKVELKLRLYGSKSVVKYPRCSIRRLATYSDAEEDPSQVFALASVWLFLLASGASVVLVPLIYSISMAFKDVESRYMLYTGSLSIKLPSMMNVILLMGLGCLVGYTISSASVQALQGLLKKDLVALKGSCPNCGEEVFAFVRTNGSSGCRHRADCHVCVSTLEFRIKVEQSFESPSRRWVYGRVYLVRRI